MIPGMKLVAAKEITIACAAMYAALFTAEHLAGRTFSAFFGASIILVLIALYAGSKLRNRQKRRL